MRPLAVTFLLLINVPILLFGKTGPLYDSLRSDSSGLEQTIKMGPQFSSTFNSLGRAVYLLDNERILSNAAGVPVFNTLYGQVPNLHGALNFDNLSSGWRASGAAPVIIIDGIPYNAAISNINNLNTFEYSDLAVLSSMVTVSPYASGAFIMNSKTGEGFNRPTLEFNSAMSYLKDGSFSNPLYETKGSWIATNSLAYKQDFGIYDTRISINHYKILEDGVDDLSTKDARYGLKMNNGLRLGKTFSARLLTEYTLGKDEMESTNYYSLFSKTKRWYFNNQLQLSYSPLRWLRFSANAASQKNSRDNYSAYNTQNSFGDQNELDDRLFANTFVHIEKDIVKKLTLSAFGGLQVEGHHTKATLQSGTQSGISKFESSTNYGVMSKIFGVTTNLNDVWYVQFLKRHDDVSVNAYTDAKDMYSLSSSFVFSKFLRSNHIITLGKIRAGYSDADFIPISTYPYQGPITSEPTPSLNSKKAFETGIDISAFKDRIGFSFTYFKDHEDYATRILPIPGFISFSHFIDYRIDTDGLEMTLRATILKNKKFIIASSLLVGSHKQDQTLFQKEVTPVELSDFFRRWRRPEQSQGIGSTLANNQDNFSSQPDWNIGSLNQIRYKGINLNFLVDARSLKNYPEYTYEYGYDVYLPRIRIIRHQEVSYLKLREASIGYDFPLKNIRALQIAQVSVIARNLWLIHSDLEYDPELNGMNHHYKNISLNIYLSF